MEKARVLKLEDVIRWDRKVMWLETRDTAGAIPVTYHAEHVPFLRFDAEDRVMMIEVRAGMYGKTWRCWDRDPAGAASLKDWKETDEDLAEMKGRRETGKAERKPAAGKAKGGAAK